MKIYKISLSLAALGVVSLASVAQANTTIYFTGSTAARAAVFAACTNSVNGVFTGGATIVSPSPNNVSGASYIVFEGTIAGITGTVDLDCDWSGSEAGIAAVAGVPLTQVLTTLDPNVPASPGTETFALPNSTPAFLTAASGWVTTATLPTGTLPDLSMADTSQAVSRTPDSGSTKLVDYGVVGVIPFTWMKGYEASPDAPWNDMANVTTAELNPSLADGYIVNANLFTGVASDASDGVAIIGRNLGSGTRVDMLLNAAQYGVTTPIQQYAYGANTLLYPSATPGTLTFAGTYGNQAITPVGNDGFDSGSAVQKSLNVDGSGNGVVPIGYTGIPDAINALTFTPSSSTGNLGGAATALTFNGVFESDSAVVNGNYSYWGQEHLLGQNGQSSSSSAGKTGAAIVSGIAGQLSLTHAGTATGNIVNNTKAQSLIIPLAVMEVSRGSDGGFPTQ
jgi:hypothetical protein